MERGKQEVGITTGEEQIDQLCAMNYLDSLQIVVNGDGAKTEVLKQLRIMKECSLKPVALATQLLRK